MKLSKRTIIIGISTLAVIGGALGYYFSTKDNGDVKSWSDSNWLYRKSINVSNSGSTLTNEDVLITVDSAALVSAGKLQNDCGDFRFVDSDDSTYLAYWVEGGCNTSNTQVWVRIPSLTAGGKTIYMYYGNDAASNGEESWSGNFILLSSGACPTGWTRSSTYDGKFTYGSSTYGTSFDGKHNHGQASCTTSTRSGGTLYNSANDDSPDTSATLANHTHANAKVDVSDAIIDPPYVGLYFCTNPDLTHFSNSIGIFNTSSSNLPTGFTYYSALEGRYPKGNDGYIASGGSDTHTHTTVGGYNTDNSTSSSSDDAYSSTTAAVPHYHVTLSGTTGTGNNNIPYYTVTYGQVSTDTVPTTGIIEMTSVVPPLGWTYFSNLQGKFPLGSTTAGTSYAGATHTHSITISTGGPNGTKQGVYRTSGSTYILDTTHTHTCTTTSSAVQAYPPYISTIFVQRKSSQATTSSEEQTNTGSPLAPSSLLTEGQINPTGVTDTTPEFSAIFSDTDPDDTANSYQIQVNTSSNFDGTTMWDSSQTTFGTPIANNTRSSDITYNGNALTTDNVTYYWKIRFWDSDGNMSEWSSVAQFTMSPSAWQHENLVYRLPITISNSTGSTLTNEDVLITIDTATLISENKLQNDCDDIRFANSTSPDIAYWIEGGCNTPSTNIWIRIDSLPPAGKIVYMYHGDASATNAEESWSGNFTLLADATCPTGWTRNADFDGKFVYGSTSYGTSGGSSASHNHGGSISVTTGTPTSTVPPRDPGAGGSAAATSNHTHTVSIPITGATIVPPYLTMIFCKNTDLNISSGLITLFDNSTLPSNWTRFSSLDNRFPYGGSSYGTTGGVSTHTHTVSSATTSGQSANLSINIGYVNYQVVNLNRGTHTHTATPSMTTNSNMPPYITMVYAKASTSPVYSSMITMVNALPPLGWTRFSALDNNFGLGGSTYGTTGGTTTHTHTVTVTTGAASSNADNDGGGNAVSAGTHSHNQGSAITSSESNLPAYLTTIYAQRKLSQSASVGTEEIQNSAPNAPSSLLTEGLTNPTGISDTAPEFSAIFTDSDTTDTGSYYQIQINTASDFSGTSMWDSTKTAFSPVIANGNRSSDISYAGTTLQLGTTYYWRIKFWDNNSLQSESEWSTTAQFTMNFVPTAPTSLYCAGATNPMKVTTSTPTFSAIFNDPDTSDTGTYYQIQVNTNSNFNGTSMWDSTKTAISSVTNGARSSNITYAGSSLIEGETYSWRIKFWDNNDHEGIWASTAQFTMQGIPDNPSGLLTNGKQNPTILTDIPPIFSAIYSDPNTDNASAYQIQVNTNPSFTGTTMWDSGKISTSVSNGQRSPDYEYTGTSMSNSHTTYYWRIKFWDSDNSESAWSETATFVDTYSSFKFNGLKIGGIKLN